MPEESAAKQSRGALQCSPKEVVVADAPREPKKSIEPSGMMTVTGALQYIPNFAGGF